MSAEHRAATEAAENDAHGDGEAAEQPPFDPPTGQWW